MAIVCKLRESVPPESSRFSCLDNLAVKRERYSVIKALDDFVFSIHGFVSILKLYRVSFAS